MMFFSAPFRSYVTRYIYEYMSHIRVLVYINNEIVLLLPAPQANRLNVSELLYYALCRVCEHCSYVCRSYSYSYMGNVHINMQYFICTYISVYGVFHWLFFCHCFIFVMMALCSSREQQQNEKNISISSRTYMQQRGRARSIQTIGFNRPHKCTCDVSENETANEHSKIESMQLKLGSMMSPYSQL